ncbi:uncharacterized protein [Hoplias malabaricus]|uniref:uncharacterized protein n=1 Tax=Hoplias malabaricus TaxID=27720 RepID=UPI00346269F9
MAEKALENEVMDEESFFLEDICASSNKDFTVLQSLRNESEAVAGSYSHLGALFGITEQTVLRSVQERMKKCVFGGFSDCPQLTAALVSEVFHAVNAAVQKTMVKEAWGCSKPLFCRHPFKSCTQTGDELVSSVTARVEDLIREQAAGNSGAPETDVTAAVAEVLWVIKDQITGSETSEEAVFSLDLVEFILNNVLMVKVQERSCSPASDGSWSSGSSDLDLQSVELPDFASESEDKREEEGKSWVILRKQGHDDKDRVLMSSLVDTVQKASQKTSKNVDPKPVISWTALTLCIQAILRRIQGVASTDVQKSQLAAVTEQQVLELTYSVWTIMALATVVRLGNDEHALPELHPSIVDEAYEALLRRMGSVSDLVEAVYTRREILCEILTVSIVWAILRADPKYIWPPGYAPETPASVSSPSLDPVTLLLLRVLARSEPAPEGCCWKKRSSNSQKEDLMERVLLEVSSDSGSERIQTALRGTFDELRQRFGEERLLRMVMNPHDSSVTRALTRALEKLLGGSRAEGEPEDTKRTTKKLRNIFSSLRKLSLFKTKSKEGKKSGPEDGDPDGLPSCSTQNAAPSQEKKQKKGSIFSRMFSSFRKPDA